MSAEAAPEQTTRVAAYAICRDDHERVLLVRIAPGYPAVGKWTLPGGGLNFGEDPAVGVLRELTEETGLKGDIEALAFVHSYVRGPMPDWGTTAFHAIRIVYRVRVTGGELRDEVEESTDRAGWFSVAEARALPLVELVELALDHLADG
jgi:ADP-ribose pyrophosphatase YjhB (NUDIX family)